MLLALTCMMAQAQDKVMVIADPHVLAGELCNPESQSCKDMMESQRKMLDLSDAAWCALMDTAMKYQPALLLIPGDLTKDSEKASHNKVVKSLKQLHAAGIKTLVIPGNHDIGGKAYAYTGDTKTVVDSLKDSEWESTYSWVYENAAKDKNSHSFAAEPLDGLTVIGIDGSNKSAGTGSLSKATLTWILEQADAARTKGNMIIAMSHWQILEHFDQQGTLESSCRFKNADALRDSLMHHGVHVVLTGHFHVNGITTFRDTTGQTNDSIIEITTGSPITYPCPYRWLTLSEDRANLSVETATIRSLGTITDMETYSRDWMKVHTKNLIPVMGKRVLAQKDELINKVISQYSGSASEAETLVKLVNMSLPQDEDAQIELFERHLGNTVIELYLVHSDANEPEHPEADSLAQEVYKGMDNLIDEVTIENSNTIISYGWKSGLGQAALAVMRPKVREYAEEPLQSLAGDTTHWKSAKYYDRTDDLHLTLKINKPRQPSDLNEPIVNDQMEDGYYDLLGRPVAQPIKGQIYIHDGKKILY